MMETKAASCCASLAIPLTKFLLSLAITIVGVPAAGILIPTTQRPLPVQHVPVGGGAILHLPHPDYVHAYVPDSHATCPSVALLGLVGLGLIVTVLLHVRSAARALDAASTYLFAFALTAITTVWAKNFCGFYRPNFFEGCGWNATTLECEHEYIDGRHSFPSGHASFSAVAAAVVTLYALQALEAAAARGGGHSLRTRALAVAVPVPAAVATWVAATRVHDNVHHPADVACGSFLGVTCAALVFALATGGAAPRSAPLLEIGTEMTERRSEAGAIAG